MIDYGLASAYHRELLEQLMVPKRTSVGDWYETDKHLIPRLGGKLWTEHSERHWMVSVAAVLGINKEQRDFLGRWGLDQHQSNDYILTSKQVILDVQTRIMKSLCEGGSLTYDEDELLATVGDGLKQLGLESEDFHKNHDVLLRGTNGRCLMQTFPTFTVSAPHVDSIVPEWVSPETTVGSSTSGLSSGKGPSPYWISIGKRSGFRRLRRAHGCGIFPWSCHETEEIFKLGKDVADAYCKRCFPDVIPDAEDAVSSSSSSSSETDDEPYYPEPTGDDQSEWSMAAPAAIQID